MDQKIDDEWILISKMWLWVSQCVTRTARPSYYCDLWPTLNGTPPQKGGLAGCARAWATRCRNAFRWHQSKRKAQNKAKSTEPFAEQRRRPWRTDCLLKRRRPLSSNLFRAIFAVKKYSLSVSPPLGNNHDHNKKQVNRWSHHTIIINVHNNIIRAIYQEQHRGYTTS